MIINLVGPPTAGKSTFAAKFVMEHPYFRYCPIDEYRIEYADEGRAWAEMTKDVLEKRKCIIESCGMGWRLGELFNLATMRRRPLITIAFTAEKHVLLQRLKERQKRPLPEGFNPEDELLALNYALEHLYSSSIAKIDHSIDTTYLSEQDIYQQVNEWIVLFMSESQKKVLRSGMFPSKSPSKETQLTKAKEL